MADCAKKKETICIAAFVQVGSLDETVNVNKPFECNYTINRINNLTM